MNTYAFCLGTYYFAVSRVTYGKPCIVKSDNGEDFIPTCVAFTKRKAILTGQSAYNIYTNLKQLEIIKTYKYEQIKN